MFSGGFGGFNFGGFEDQEMSFPYFPFILPKFIRR